MIIELVCLGIATTLATVGSLTFWPVQAGYDFYIPIVLFIAGYLLGLAFWWIFLWIFGRQFSLSKEYDKPVLRSRFWYIQVLQYINLHALVKTKMTGLDKIPLERFLIVCNHVSNFDPMIISEKLGNKDIAFIAKRENFKLPLAPRIINSLCFMAIDRNDPLQSLQVIKRSISLIENNATSIGVFPEGTRHKDGVLGEFHEGVFNIALKSKCPIVVMTLTNTKYIHKHFPFRLTKVNFDVLKVIEPLECEGKTAKEISDLTKSIMSEHLERIAK